MNFVTKVIDKGGDIAPILIPPELTKGTGLFNPSVLVDNKKILVNLRHCQYTIWHSEKNNFEHEYGPLVYLNPENDMTLTTTNYICELDSQTLAVKEFSKVDTSFLDVKPMWEFVGLEDARLVRWYGSLWLIGVRRDTTTNGVGRMEMSKIEKTDNGYREVERYRLPAPYPDESYCEKNWMPVLDMNSHFVKWTNPTEVVYTSIDPITKVSKTETVNTIGQKVNPYDYRGGSQVITIGDYRVCLVHTVILYQSEAGRKNARYRHAFVVWDKNWNIVRVTDEFSFMDAEIEFCCGMAEFGDDILITFGFQDNAAYILRCPKDYIVKEILKL